MTEPTPPAPPAEADTPDHPEQAEGWRSVTVDELLYDLEAAARSVDRGLLGYHPDDWRDAARTLHQIRQSTARLKRLDSKLGTWLYLHGEHGMHQLVEGIGAVSITRGRAKERWAAEEAVAAYVAAKIEANGGEYPDPSTVVDWVLEVVPATASTNLRKPPLRDAGIDVQDYYASEPGTISIGLPT